MNNTLKNIDNYKNKYVKKFDFRNLYEVEHFLQNLKKSFNYIKLYKLLK